MFRLLRLVFGLFPRALRSRREPLMENLLLRQQLSVLKRRNRRPTIPAIDELFWVAIQGLCSGWKHSLILVSPETVVRWHRAGFRLYWSWLSRHRSCVGRKRISKDLREIIFRMVVENSTWGAPRASMSILRGTPLRFVSRGSGTGNTPVCHSSPHGSGYSVYTVCAG